MFITDHVHNRPLPNRLFPKKLVHNSSRSQKTFITDSFLKEQFQPTAFIADHVHNRFIHNRPFQNRSVNNTPFSQQTKFIIDHSLNRPCSTVLVHNSPLLIDPFITNHVHYRPVHNSPRPLQTTSQQTRSQCNMFITDTFMTDTFITNTLITDTFITDPVHKKPSS